MIALKNIIFVGIGGFLGSSLRYLISEVSKHLWGSSLPFGTFIANILGCCIFGYVTGYFQQHGKLSTTLLLLLTTGFCGGLTTFSTFINESYNFTNSHQYFTMMGYLVISLIIGLTAVYCGLQLSKFLS